MYLHLQIQHQITLKESVHSYPCHLRDSRLLQQLQRLHLPVCHNVHSQFLNNIMSMIMIYLSHWYIILGSMENDRNTLGLTRFVLMP